MDGGLLTYKGAILFTHEMRKADTDEVAATTTLTGVHLDTVARRARAFPDNIRQKAAALVKAS